MGCLDGVDDCIVSDTGFVGKDEVRIVIIGFDVSFTEDGIMILIGI